MNACPSKAPRIPQLQDFGLSAVTGFLGQIPLVRLTHPYYEPWERALDDISHLLVAWKMRSTIHRLPELETSHLRNEQEYERAFLVLSLLSHAYVWGAKGEPVLDLLPRNLAVPWSAVALHLGLRPISCHAALVYYNWKPLDFEGPLDLSNLATLHTISGGMDESWFYLITVAIEARGAKALPSMVSALHAIEKRDTRQLAVHLKEVAEAIESIGGLLMRMSENCDPYIFYHRVRIYFSGWSNMQALAQGLLYEGDQQQIETMFIQEGWASDASIHLSNATHASDPRRKRYPGGSAAQSSLIHTLDVFLGVRHYPTGTSDSLVPPSSNHVNFIQEMRFHIPRRHRQWLSALEEAPSVHGFIEQLLQMKESISVDDELAIDTYNKCVEQMKRFRDLHIQIVTRYILIPQRQAQRAGQDQTSGSIGYHGSGPQPIGRSPSPGLDSVDENEDDDDEASVQSRGTGGTDIIPFLKQSRDETIAVRVSSNTKSKEVE